MTTYQGGKKRLGKRIHDVILTLESNLIGGNTDCSGENKEKRKLCYFEPFVGMGGVMIHFAKDNDRKIIGSDLNEDLILMWKALQKGWKPPRKCSEKKYNELKESKKHSAERGYIGVVASWGGMFFHAYRLKYAKGEKNFMDEGYRSIMKVVPDIKKVNFMSNSYDSYNPKGMLIYCDPPYKNNKLGDKKSLFQNFDHDKFWNVMRQWSKDNIVIISEWTAPSDFKKIWGADSSVVVNAQKGQGPKETKKYKDNLYVHKDLYASLY